MRTSSGPRSKYALADLLIQTWRFGSSMKRLSSACWGITLVHFLSLTYARFCGIRWMASVYQRETRLLLSCKEDECEPMVLALENPPTSGGLAARRACTRTRGLVA